MGEQRHFEETLAQLVSAEAVKAQRDPERMSALIERLGAALGLTIAVACRGDGAKMDALLEGATAYAHEEAVRNSHIIAAMGKRP